MLQKKLNLTFSVIEESTPIPYGLLLLADPSKKLIDEYLKQSQTFIARQDNEIVGIVVLLPLTEELIEIKNISVKPFFRGQGIGMYLIKNAIQTARSGQYKRICIGTANSSIGQLYLYQKLGFEICEIRKDFFIQHYPEPIFEHGVQAKDMLMLRRGL